MEPKRTVSKDRLHDETWVLFIGEVEVPPAGEFQEHAGPVEYIRGMFAKPIDDLKEDWKKVTNQIQKMLEATSLAAVENFETDSVEVSLGFSGEGHLGFLAKAGMEASVHLIFKRRRLTSPDAKSLAAG